MMTRNVREKYRGSLCLVLSILGLICLVSCYPEFKNPLPPPPELKADPQILGTWLGTNEAGSKEQLLIFQRSSGWIDVVLIDEIDSKESEDGINVGIFEGYSTSVNRQKFLCLRVRKKDYSHVDPREIGEPPFYIVNYETPSDNKLIIKHFSIEKIEELIKEGKLKGEIAKGQYVDKVTVTSSSDELVEVISREGAGAFIEQDPNYNLVFSRSKT
jgi:hypothetical protein